MPVNGPSPSARAELRGGSRAGTIASGTDSWSTDRRSRRSCDDGTTKRQLRRRASEVMSLP